MSWGKWNDFQLINIEIDEIKALKVYGQNWTKELSDQILVIKREKEKKQIQLVSLYSFVFFFFSVLFIWNNLIFTQRVVKARHSRPWIEIGR